MSRYWSYLTNKQNQILAFETQTDLEKMKSDYDSLIKFNFFSQFEGYTKIFVSDKNPAENPIDNKLFELNF